MEEGAISLKQDYFRLSKHLKEKGEELLNLHWGHTEGMEHGAITSLEILELVFLRVWWFKGISPGMVYV